jgi:hypothetical protein
MASAFNSALLTNLSKNRPSSNPEQRDIMEQEDEQKLPRSWHPSPERPEEEETEDEEVKMNCIGGLHAYEESDMSSEEEEEEDSSDDDEDDNDGASPVERTMKRSDVGVVHFVARQVDSPGGGSITKIERPQPVVVQTMKSPSQPDDDESDMDESDESSVGGRGLGLSLDIGENVEQDENDDSSMSGEEEDSEDEEEDDEAPTSQAVAGGDCSDEESVALSVSQEEFENLQDSSEIRELQDALESDIDQEQHEERYKRVLSSSALLGPSASSSDLIMESPKRLRCFPGAESGSDQPSSLPPLDLGPSAADAKDPADSPTASSSDAALEDEDQQLREELQESGSEDDDDRTSTPIPLLTPPASPVQIDGDDGPATICEWPSNLTVDIALTAAADLRPPSPTSFQKAWDEQEECNSKDSGPSTLTPLIRGISVNLD